MVDLARERAPGAEVVLGEADRLPFANGMFTAVAMAVVFFFLDDPVRVLQECRRVLGPVGRVAVYTTAPELRGTPAAPEPLASLGSFYTLAELAQLAGRAGLQDISVRADNGGQLLIARALSVSRSTPATWPVPYSALDTVEAGCLSPGEIRFTLRGVV